MRQHHALRPAGRARRVDDRRDVAVGSPARRSALAARSRAMRDAGARRSCVAAEPLRVRVDLGRDARARTPCSAARVLADRVELARGQARIDDDRAWRRARWSRTAHATSATSSRRRSSRGRRRARPRSASVAAHASIASRERAPGRRARSPFDAARCRAGRRRRPSGAGIASMRVDVVTSAPLDRRRRIIARAMTSCWICVVPS